MLLRAYLELAKPRITTMVAATAAVGWALGGGAVSGRFALLLLGTSLASAAAGALNQYLEREQDALMERTKGRPLPSGRLPPSAALRFPLWTLRGQPPPFNVSPPAVGAKSAPKPLAPLAAACKGMEL